MHYSMQLKVGGHRRAQQLRSEKRLINNVTEYAIYKLISSLLHSSRYPIYS